MKDRTDNARLEAFCDAIIAIAITLLIIDIRVPELDAVSPSAPLGSLLAAEWPSWFAFLLTFLTLFIAWTNHHHALAQLDKTSSPFIYANGFLMLTVVVFPFSAGLLGRYLDTDSAGLVIILYCLTNMVHNLGWLAVFYFARKPTSLARDAAHQSRIENVSRVVTYTLALNVGIVAVAFWYPIIALILVTAAWLFYLFAGIFWTSIE
jgi:uncharacterized membrane protein